MINLEYLRKQDFTENGKLCEIFQLSEGYINLLLELGFEYNYEDNLFYTYFEIDNSKYKASLYRSIDKYGSYMGMTIRKEIIKEKGIDYEWYANRSFMKDINEKTENMSPMGLLFWLEYHINKLEASSNKTFTKFNETEKHNG